MTVTALRPSSRQPLPVDVESLSLRELEVAFYAADYHRTPEEMAAGGDVLRMVAAVTAAVTDLGIDLIREVADLFEQVTVRGDIGLRDRLTPDRVRLSHAQGMARCLRRLLTGSGSALDIARTVERWQMALTGAEAEAVAA